MGKAADKPRKTERKRPENVETIRASSMDIDALYGLSAAVTEMENLCERVPRRIEAINGWKKVNTIRTLLIQLVEDMAMTYPKEKLVMIHRALPNMAFRIIRGPQASLRKDEVMMEVGNLSTIIMHAHEQCKLCLDPDGCRRCDLGRALDQSLGYDRDGTSWQDVYLDDSLKALAR